MRVLKSILLVIISLEAMGQAANSFLPGDLIAQSSVFQWTGQNGLISNNITSSLQTKSGFIWITTYNGLMRFDGRSVEVFDRNTLPFLTTDAFYRVYEDETGLLWFASQGSGLITYDGHSFKSVEPTNGKIPRSIRSLHLEKNGRVWIGSNNEGLVILDGNKIEKVNNPLLKDITISDIVRDNAGTYWIATDGNGVVKYSPNHYEQFTNTHGLLSNSINTLKVVDNKIYIGTTLGLNQIIENKVSTLQGVTGSPINDITLGPDGLLWVATENGLVRMGEAVVEKVGESDGPFTRINGITFDREGSSWISTGRNGLIQIKQTGIRNFGAAQGLSSSRINIIVQTGVNEYFIGSDGGDVDVFKNGQLKRLPLKTPLNFAGIRDICRDDDGNLWIASYNGVIRRSPNGTEKLFGLNDGLPAIDMRRILKDKQGNLWFASRSGGVVKFSKNKIQTIYNKSNGLGSNYVLALEEAPDGTIYVGTHSGGLTIIKPDGSTQLLHVNEDDAGILIFNIHIAKDLGVWIVTNSGIYRLNNQQFRKIELEGLSKGETFFDLLQDKEGNFWVTANVGVFRLSRNEIEKFLEEKIKGVPTKLFDNQDGMINKECTGATRSLISSSGQLWIPTIGGVSVFYPERIQENKIIPPVYVTSIITDKLTVRNDSATIEAGNLRYSFNFTALSYWSPSKVKFKYKLEGVDPQWVTAGTARQAEYTNLKPGTYTFRVIACNNDGLWNEKGAVMTFTVEPFYYQTAWFYITLIGVSATLLYGIYRWRINRIEKRNAELRKLNNELDKFVYSTSHDLRAPLASILGLVNLSRMEKENRDYYIDLIEKSVKKLDEFISEIIDYSRNARLDVDPIEIDFRELLKALLENLEYLEEKKNITKNITVTGSAPFFSDKTRISIILNNLISNAIKYHDRHKNNPIITIDVNYNGTQAAIRVSDNGVGIAENHLPNIFKMFFRASTDSKGSGLGLYIVKETVEKLGGTISVSSTIGKGSTFEVVLPSIVRPKN